MDLTLGISTSSSQFKLVLGEKNKIFFYSRNDQLINSTKDDFPLVKDLSPLLTQGLERIGRKITEIGKVIVDVGPGGTSSVRTGVSFANGLSYSLGIPVYPVPSLELIGIEVWEKYETPVGIMVKSIKGNAFVGLYDGKILTLKYGIPENFAQEMFASVEELAIAGIIRKSFLELFPDKKIRDSGVQSVRAQLLIEKSDVFLNRAMYFPNLPVPVTEQLIPNL